MMSLPGYFDHASVDRIEPTGGYTKDNVRWATQQVQTRNKKEHCRMANGELLVNAIERLKAYDFKSSIRVWFLKGRVTTDKDIIDIRDRNMVRREEEKVTKRILQARPDYCVESVRGWRRKGWTEDAIIDRIKWGGCGDYQTKTCI